MRNSQQQQSSWMNIVITDGESSVTLAGFALPETMPKKASASCSVAWRFVNALQRKAVSLAEQGQAEAELLTQEQFFTALAKAGLSLGIKVRNPQEAEAVTEDEDEFF